MKGEVEEMEKKKAVTLAIVTLLFLVINIVTDQPSASACTIQLGKKVKFNMEISPKTPLFDPAKDGYFYPGSPKITKNLQVKNVGNVPFRICRLSATFHGDTYLATGLQIKIVELGTGKGEKPHLLYHGILNNLGGGIEVNGKNVIPQRKSVILQITVWMPETAGNEYQGLSMTADIAITVHFPPAYDGRNC